MFYRVSQSLIMGTVTIANALAFAPNFQKGLTAAGKVAQLLNRVPRIKDTPDAKDQTWVSTFSNYIALRRIF